MFVSYLMAGSDRLATALSYGTTYILTCHKLSASEIIKCVDRIIHLDISSNKVPTVGLIFNPVECQDIGAKMHVPPVSTVMGLNLGVFRFLPSIPAKQILLQSLWAVQRFALFLVITLRSQYICT